MPPRRRYFLALGLTTVALGMASWLVVSVGEMHDRLSAYSPELAVGFVTVSTGVAAVSAISAARLFWISGRPERPQVQAPEDVIKAAEVQADEAASVVAQVADEAARERLRGELAAIRVDREVRQFHVVVFGTASAGKTSLINALLGREVGEVGPTMGTTLASEAHTHSIEGVDGTVLLTDTPGLSDAGAGGPDREREARDLAARADLLVFVLEHDLIRSEFEPMTTLARRGKRSIVVLNKADRLDEADRAAILAKLRERLAGVVPPADIVPVSAAPRATPVRVVGVDGKVETVLEAEPPDLAALRARIAAVLDGEGDHLRAGNLLLRAHLVGQAARDQVGLERDAKARKVIDKFQWLTAATVFTNPLPVLDLMATGAVQYQMIAEIGAVYGVQISGSHVKTIGSQMLQLMLKLGLVEASSSLIAGLFKSTLVGYAAGGAIQGVTMAYLTHISGLTFTDYFRKGQTWGDGGMQAALAHQFQLHSRADFLREFALQALERVKRPRDPRQNAG